MDWIFYSWGISLTHEGSSLAAECLIELLSRFESVQVAGIGMTGLPLASSIVSLGKGRYSGLYVRPLREVWGTRRRIEGAGDRTRPVVIVDDCICAGDSMKAACTALESDGYRVEGAVSLVNFPGKAVLNGQGDSGIAWKLCLTPQQISVRPTPGRYPGIAAWWLTSFLIRQYPTDFTRRCSPVDRREISERRHGSCAASQHIRETVMLPAVW